MMEAAKSLYDARFWLVFVHGFVPCLRFAQPFWLRGVGPVFASPVLGHAAPFVNRSSPYESLKETLPARPFLNHWLSRAPLPNGIGSGAEGRRGEYQRHERYLGGSLQRQRAGSQCGY